MTALNIASPSTTGITIQMALGQHFVRSTSANLPPSEGPQVTPEETQMSNVVAMSAQVRWLAAQAQAGSLQFDPGVPDPRGDYPLPAFATAVNALLAGMIDEGITYTASTFMPNHKIVENRWYPGAGHIFKLLANGVPLTSEARIEGVDFLVETLISVGVAS